MTIKHLYPTTRPTLNLDFAKTKQLDPRITFSRASTGTYVDANGVIQSAATDTARFDHNPTTGESLGLLIEVAGTNLLQQSAAISTSPWSLVNSASVTADTTAAPDGTTTADTLGGITTASYIEQTIPWTASGNWTLSLFMKAGTATRSKIYINRGASQVHGTSIDWSSGVPSASSTFGCSVSFQALASGWYKVVLQLTSVVHTTTNSLRITSDFIAGTGTAIVWGVQAEENSYATSYIPTTTATVTRAADVFTITGTNFSSWYNPSEGTLAVETPNGLVGLGVAANLSFLGISTGALGVALTTGDGIKYGSGSPSTNTRAFIVTSGTTVFDSSSAINAGKVAIAYKQDDFAIARSSTLGTDTSGNVPTGMDRFTLRAYGATPYKRITYWPTRLSDATLQAITS